MTNRELIDQLNREKMLSHAHWQQLIMTYSPYTANYAAKLANKLTVERFGKNIFFRGIIEFTNYCRCDCLYCGIRRSSRKLKRYRLSKEEILACCQEGYDNGFRTFVLQGGEDNYYTDPVLEDLVYTIRHRFTDCAITLSIGERSRQSYKTLFEAGADRYLLRHETASKDLYKRWHPAYQRYDDRMRCLWDLKDIGYQTGCGFMVGAPYQTAADLAMDMEFITEFSPAMVGVGPFLAHCATPWNEYPNGSTELTLFLLSLCRILHPNVLLPATTALGTAKSNGRQLGVLAGCNVIMPNLSPLGVRNKYLLYDNKAGTNDTAASGIAKLTAQMAEIGYNVVPGRGDYAGNTEH